jgi:hypothetical protein
MSKQILNSSLISQLVCLPNVDEPDLRSLAVRQNSVIFIGNSHTYSMPALLDFDKLLNPHMLIVGMTGSGKTFLMKNMILRLSVFEESIIILIDFTGEYQNRLKMHISNLEDMGLGDYSKNEITYFNLAGSLEQEKIRSCSKILEHVLILMRSQEINGKRRIFVVLDEAWKLLKSDKSLETIIREGRKYGVGLILSSQLIEDADNPIISNIATLFMFRTQNKKSIEKIAKNYNLSEEYASKIQNLDIGSCLTVQIYRSNHRSAFIIRKVMGLNFKDTVKIGLDDTMGIDVGLNELETLIEKLCNGKNERISSLIKQQGCISLNELTKQLLSCGANSMDTFRELKKLGIDDYALSDSFSFALSEFSDQNESDKI